MAGNLMAHRRDSTIITEGQTAAQLRESARKAITRLQAIEALSSPTNAQVVAAVKDLATYERHLIRIVVGALT